MEILRDVGLVVLGYLVAELSAHLKWRRDRRDRLEDRGFQEQRRRQDREQQDEDSELEACVRLLAAVHRVAIGGVLEGWQQARVEAMESLSRVRLLAPPDIALSASRHYSAAIGRDKAELYQATLADLINRLRDRFGRARIREFEEFLDEPMSGT
jgi:hypothetical protein